jgi:hypothetical protein
MEAMGADYQIGFTYTDQKEDIWNDRIWDGRNGFCSFRMRQDGSAGMKERNQQISKESCWNWVWLERGHNSVILWRSGGHYMGVEGWPQSQLYGFSKCMK